MKDYTVTFLPQNVKIKVTEGTTLLEAAAEAGIHINNLCGGDGICGRCKMIVQEGDVSGEVSGKLSREEIKKGYVLACMTCVRSDLIINVPPETLATERTVADKDAERFKSLPSREYIMSGGPCPLVTKVYLDLKKPSLNDSTADHQRVCEAIEKELNISATVSYTHLTLPTN